MQFAYIFLYFNTLSHVSFERCSKKKIFHLSTELVNYALSNFPKNGLGGKMGLKRFVSLTFI